MPSYKNRCVYIMKSLHLSSNARTMLDRRMAPSHILQLLYDVRVDQRIQVRTIFACCTLHL